MDPQVKKTDKDLEAKKDFAQGVIDRIAPRQPKEEAAHDRFTQDFHTLVGSAKGKDPYEELVKWDEGRNIVGLYLAHGENPDDPKRYVIGDIDRWYHDPKYTVDEARYASAKRSADAGQYLTEEQALEYYTDAVKPSLVERIMRSLRGYIQ